MTYSPEPTIILGGGFAGLFAALHLSHKNYPHPIILVDQQERFTFNPLLYEFLSGEMGEDQICPRYEELLAGSGVKFMQDTVARIDLRQRQVELASTTYTYSNLVLALGCTSCYLNVEGAQEYSLPFRTGTQAVTLAKKLRDCLENASKITDAEERRKLLTVAIVGAGPSGVELAATLADLLPIWYRELGGNGEEIRVVLLDRGTEILAGGPRGGVKSALLEAANEALATRHVPVELLLETTVNSVSQNSIKFTRHDQTQELAAATVIWTAGIATNPLLEDLPISPAHRDQRGRLQVTPTLQLVDFPEVFAGGDCAANTTDSHPPTAQVAYQQGRAIAHNLASIAQGKEPAPLHVKVSGTLLKLGLGESAAQVFNRFEIKGKLGHTIRQATYLELLPTPVHNLKATAEWLVEDIFHHHYNPAHLPGVVISKEA